MVTETKAVAGTLTFLVVPLCVGVLVPLGVLVPDRQSSPWFLVLGGILFILGSVVLLDAFARFALEGRGTPAPPVPTEILVVSGFYRFVRNPMYLAVTSWILGEAIAFRSVVLFWYALIVWLSFYLFVLLYEEPTLRHRFGKSYRDYCGEVPRWWPRFKPYTPSETSAPSVPGTKNGQV